MTPLFALAVLLPLTAQTPVAPQAAITPATSAHTPADRGVELALRALSSQPDLLAYKSAVAMALVQETRESGDPAPCAVADSLIDEVLAVAPDDYAAGRVRTQSFLAQSRFQEALVLARVLNRRAPDDLANYAAIVEAGIALKRLDEAEEAAQWMLDLRPDDLTCAEHAALVRAAEGDPEGALELLTPAAKVISPERAFESAWVATESARCELALGHVEKARALVQAALGALPEYHVALALAAKLAARGGDHATSAAFLRVRFENGPTDANRASLIEALERAGLCDEAAALSH